MKKLAPVILSLLCCLLTAASMAQEKPYQFAWLSDIHIVAPESSSVHDLRESVKDINADESIQFTIITGDIADFGHDSMLLLARHILDGLEKPYYIVPGNHDTKWSESGATAFNCVFGHRNIRFDYDKLAFIGYQTGPILRRGDGYIAPDDFQWIKKQCEMARKEGKTIIPFSHYPLTKSMSNWHKLAELFRQYSVPVVLSGHYHRYGMITADSIPNVITRTNRSRKNLPVGYTIVRVANDSMYFSKREPTLDKTTAWVQLSIRPVDYSKKEIKPFTPDLSVNRAYSQVQVAWKRNFQAGISSESTISDGKLLFGDRAGILHCLALADGKELWQYKTGKSIFSTPAVSDDKVVFGSVDGYIYCLNINDGKLNWKFKTNTYVLSSPTITDNTVYIGASDDKFRAIDLQTGKLRWVFSDLRGWVQTKPVIYEGKVYFGAWDNYFYALDANTGTLAWKWIRSKNEGYPSAFYAPAACWPVAANNKVFIAGPDMILTALNAQTGETLWRAGDPKLNEALGISEDGSKVFVKCTFDSTLLAYNTTSSTSEVAWKTASDYGFDDNESPIAEKDGVVFFTFRNGMVIAADSHTGKTLWEHRLGVVMLNGATPVNDKEVVITDVDGNIQLLKSR